jgi:hypothetical protein
MAKDCTYRFTDRDGKERVIQGQAAFKAYLVDGGLEHLLPSAPVALSARQGDLNGRFRQQIFSDFDAAVREYKALPDTKNGKLLDTDQVRELSPEYRADRSLAPQVHEAASAFTQRAFEERMANAPDGALVIFMAGGGGAGKSSAEHLLSDAMERANTILDGTLSSYDKASRNVQLALDNNQTVRIAYVYREPLDALASEKGGVLERAMKRGRPVTLEALVKGHVGSSEVVRKLQSKFGDNPNFKIQVIDNSRGAGNAVMSTLEDVPAVQLKGLMEKFKNATDQALAEGRISETIHRATTTPYDTRETDGGQGQRASVRPGDGRETERRDEPGQAEYPVDEKLERWADSIFKGRGNVTESKILSDRLPHPSLSMGPGVPLGDRQMVVLDGHALDHAAKHVEDGITARMIGQLPAALKAPRMVTFQAPGQLLVMLPLRAANGAPIVVALKKEEVKGGGTTLKVTRFATTYPLENSASYIVREMRKGNRVWLPGEEVSRLRDLLGRFNTTQGTGQGQQLTNTLALPLARGGNQAVKDFSVLSDAALAKKQANEKGWERETETVSAPNDAEKQLQGIAFAKRQPVGKETEGWLLSRDELGRFRFGAGAKAYRYAADVANAVLDVVGMKPVSPELSRAMRKMRMEVDKAQNLTVEVAKTMKDLPDQERQMISDVIEGELKRGAKPPKRVLEIAASMQDIMSEQSAELVRLGMLSKDAAGRWDGKYLPRFYEQKLGDETKAWMKAVKGLLGRKQTMQGIKGSSLKARGMFETVPVADLADWEAEGWAVRDATYDPAVDTEITVWRDYTRTERDDMGEIRDAMFRFVMGYNKSQRDIALGRLYENLAATYASKTEQPGYVQVPATNVEDTFAKRYGKLGGKYVPSEILDQLVAFDSDMQNDLTKIYLKGLSMWKEGKTVLNPVAHANNVLSNITMAHFAGVSYWDAHKYIGSIKDLVKGDAMVEEAREAGLFGGTFNRAELTEAMPEELRVLAQMAESKSKRAVEMVWNGLSLWLRKPLGKAYNAEDEFFRYVVYRDARNNGLSVDASVDYALKYMFSYDNMPKGARVIRDMPVGLPFFSYTYKVVPALVNTALEHPVRYAAPAVAIYVANAAMYAIAASLGGGEDEDWWTIIRRYMTDPEFRQRTKDLEEQERKNLPTWMKGASLSLGTEKSIRLGMDDLTNLPVFLDVSRIFPGGDLFDAHNNAGGIPLLAPITPNSPVLTVASAMLFNKDTFRGQDIVKKTDTDAEAAQKRAAWMWKQMTPAIAVGNTHFERAMNVIANVTGQSVNVGLAEYTGIGKDGLPITPGYAALQTVGIKARPIDLDTSEKIQKAQTKALIRELEMQIKQSQRLENKGAISPTTGEAEREKLREKKQFIRQGLTVEGEEKD